MNDYGQKLDYVEIIRSGDIDIIKRLIAEGIDPHLYTSEDISLLANAANYSQCEILRLLLKNIDKNDFIEEKSNALLYAIWEHNLEMVQLLHENGADINYIWDNHSLLSSMANDGTNAIEYGYHDKHIAILRYLLDNGADVNVREAEDGCTALHNASMESLLDEEISDIETIQLLIDAGAKIHAKDNDGWNALLYATSFGHIDAVRILLANGANPNHAANDGETPLMHAAMKGYTDICIQLLDTGADILAKDNEGWDALMTATPDGYLYTMRILLKDGANPNCQTNDGETPLMRAAYEGHTEIIDLLLNAGANITLKDINGYTALDYAIEEKEDNAADLLRKRMFYTD